MATFTAYMFDGKRTAQKVLNELEDSSIAYLWIDDVAVVSKNKLGLLKIHSTWAQDEIGAAGLGWGSITGALLGALTGPKGALAGAAMGGSLYGLMGATMDAAFDDPKLDEFGADLKNDTSALVLVTDETYLEEYESVLTPYNGTLIQTDLNEDDIDYIRKKLKTN